MDSAKLNDWLQVIGLFGVIASLIFVGLQMKQEQEIAMSATYQARSEQITSITSQYALDPVFHAAMAKVASNTVDQMTAEEYLVASNFTAALLNFYENVHFQYQGGFIDEEHWAKSRSGLKNMFKIPGTRQVYENDFSGWRASFAELVDVLLKEIDAEADE